MRDRSMVASNIASTTSDIAHPQFMICTRARPTWSKRADFPTGILIFFIFVFSLVFFISISVFTGFFLFLLFFSNVVCFLLGFHWIFFPVFVYFHFGLPFRLISRFRFSIFSFIVVSISGLSVLSEAVWSSYKSYMFCLPDLWKPLDLCDMWFCWMRKVCWRRLTESVAELVIVLLWHSVEVRKKGNLHWSLTISSLLLLPDSLICGFYICSKSRKPTLELYYIITSISPWLPDTCLLCSNSYFLLTHFHQKFRANSHCYVLFQSI